jgi:acyl-CoA-binding protein
LRQLKDINDWGALKQFLDRSEVQEHQGREDLAAAVREAAERVYHQRPDKWTDERTDQVNQWLQPAGLTFEAARPEAEEELPEDVATIEALKEFGDYQQAGLDLTAMSKPALVALRDKMRQWGCADKKAKKNKQQALKEVVQALKTK